MTVRVWNIGGGSFITESSATGYGSSSRGSGGSTGTRPGCKVFENRWLLSTSRRRHGSVSHRTGSLGAIRIAIHAVRLIIKASWTRRVCTLEVIRIFGDCRSEWLLDRRGYSRMNRKGRGSSLDLLGRCSSGGKLRARCLRRREIRSLWPHRRLSQTSRAIRTSSAPWSDYCRILITFRRDLGVSLCRFCCQRVLKLKRIRRCSSGGERENAPSVGSLTLYAIYGHSFR